MSLGQERRGSHVFLFVDSAGATRSPHLRRRPVARSVFLLLRRFFYRFLRLVDGVVDLLPSLLSGALRRARTGRERH